MAVFDITSFILGISQDIYDRGQKTPWDIVDWLQDNVGEYYGRGEGNVLRVGSGWEIFTLHNGEARRPRSDEDAVITYHIDITDDQKSILFALKWVK